jgi:hypothetical protein
MSEHDDEIARKLNMTQDEIDLIDERLGQAFAFLRDVLDNPAITAAIPTGSTLRHREIEIEDRRYRLTAYRTPRMRQWAARLTAGPEPADAGAPDGVEFRLPAWDERPASPARGETAEAALDVLEGKLRRATARMALAS